VARWFRFDLSVSGPFVDRCLISRSMLRFHIPLIEPCMQISRTRLTEEVSRLRPRKVACPLLELDEPETVVKASFREFLGSRPCHLMLGT